MPSSKGFCHSLLLIVLLIYPCAGIYAQDISLVKTWPTFDVCLSDEEQELARLVHQYRRQHALPAPPLTRSLTQVAMLHVRDLQAHFAVASHPHLGGKCTLHSWSATGHWTPVCYGPDHALAAAMWNKPREITGNRYTGNGFELAYWSALPATASRVLSGWDQSPRHQAVLLETAGWQGRRWPAMGIGMYGHFAALWFGDQPDPQGLVLPCLPPAALRRGSPALVSVADKRTAPESARAPQVP